MSRSICTIAGILVVALSATMAAQRGRRGGANANAGLPVATNTILENPDAYYGKQLTISAGVERMAVQPMGKPVLVVAPYLTNTLDHRNYLLVRGELLKLDTATVARVAADYKLDLGPELWTRFHGQPILLATSVISASYAELARKPMAPPTASELAMTEAMKTLSPAFTALRAAADQSRADLVAQQVAKLQPAFSQAETIWDNLGQSAGGQWARDAQDQVAAIQNAASAGNWDGVKYSASKLNQLCTNCHNTFRDRQDDGSFRFKGGSY